MLLRLLLADGFSTTASALRRLAATSTRLGSSRRVGDLDAQRQFSGARRLDVVGRSPGLGDLDVVVSSPGLGTRCGRQLSKGSASSTRNGSSPGLGFIDVVGSSPGLGFIDVVGSPPGVVDLDVVASSSGLGGSARSAVWWINEVTVRRAGGSVGIGDVGAMTAASR